MEEGLFPGSRSIIDEDEIEEERRQSVEMMKELQALKEQLAQKDASAEPAETVESVAEDTVADSSSNIEE